ncbi:MAG: hypothetical protein Fur0010_15260 [Bdellovibrio sp.]
MGEIIGKKSSNIFVTLLIGLIVVSFMFTGYESMRGSPDTVAKVGPIPIKMGEYQREYERQLEFYRNIFGGQALTSQQIETFGIKNNALRNLAQQKLMLILAEDAQVPVPHDKIKEEIKKMPYFLTEGKFDINKYKAVLNANRISPADFENQLSDSVKADGVQSLFKTVPLSQNYLKDIESFKQEKIGAHLAQFPKESLRKLIEVNKSEVSAFLAIPENMTRVTSLFNDRKSQLDQKEEVKARHILLRTGDGKEDAEVEKKIKEIAKTLTPANFQAMAKKHTEDTSGKDNGGDLGWFSRGRMVPEFEKVAFTQKIGTISPPVKTQFGYHLILVEDKKAAKEAKFEDYRDDLAKELIRATKNDELAKIVEKTTKEIQDALRNKKWAVADKYKQLINLQYEKDSEINRYDGTVGSIFLQTEELKKIFEKGMDQNESYIFDNASTVSVVVTSPAKTVKPQTAEETEKERNGLRMALSQQLVKDIIKGMEERYPLKVYADFINQ